MKQIAFATRQEAEARSRSEWERILGRPKRRGDVTEFLWSIEDAPDGKVALIIPAEDEVRLSTAERKTLVARVVTVEEEPAPTTRGG